MRTYTLNINGKRLEAILLQRSGSTVSFSVDGFPYTVEIEPVLRNYGVSPAPHSPAPALSPAVSLKKQGREGQIAAPMPGIIVNIPVREGDAIAAGETVVVIEAMKMENNLPAPRAGKVKKIHVAKGQEVMDGAPLIDLE